MACAVRRAICAMMVWAMALAALGPVFAQAQAPGSQPQTSNSTSANQQRKEVEAAIERRIKEALLAKADEFVARRIERSKYILGVEVGLNKKELKKLVESYSSGDLSVLLAGLEKRSYESLRPYVTDAVIRLKVSRQLSQYQYAPVATTLEEYLASEGSQMESVETEVIDTAPTVAEMVVQAEAREKERLITREAEEQRKTKAVESELRKKEIQLQHELKRQEITKNEAELKSEVEFERKKRLEIADEALQKVPLSERILREIPFLSRVAAAGAGASTVLLVALVLLGIFLVIAFRTLGNLMFEGATEVANAMRQGPESRTLEFKNFAPTRDKKNKENPDEDANDDAVTAFDAKPQMKEAVEQLRAQIERDPETAAALLSKTVEQGKYGETVGIFDLLGPDQASALFAKFTSAAKKLLQRAFYTGQIERPKPTALFNRINELRTMLATTDVLMKSNAERAFAQIVLSCRDEEIAKGMVEIEQEQSATMLAVLPPERMLRIVRALPSELAAGLRTTLPVVVARGMPVQSDAVTKLTSTLLDERKMHYEENKKYLQAVIAAAEEEEIEDILKGLELDAAFCLDVIGIRARYDDLWAQATSLLEGLLSLVELEIAAFFLLDAPDGVLGAFLNELPDRKKSLLEHSMNSLRSDREIYERAREPARIGRKLILKKLSDMAASGLTILPSRERLLVKAAEQKAQAEAELGKAS
jgi:hypothetical protein